MQPRTATARPSASICGLMAWMTAA